MKIRFESFFVPADRNIHNEFFPYHISDHWNGFMRNMVNLGVKETSKIFQAQEHVIERPEDIKSLFDFEDSARIYCVEFDKYMAFEVTLRVRNGQGTNCYHHFPSVNGKVVEDTGWVRTTF